MRLTKEEAGVRKNGYIQKFQVTSDENCDLLKGKRRLVVLDPVFVFETGVFSVLFKFFRDDES